MNHLSSDDLIHVDPDLLSRWNVPVPRYTSYPTAPQFHPMEEGLYRKKLIDFDQTDKPLSLYIHIPFCKRMCLFCGCSVVLNRNPETQEGYLQLLLQEISSLPFSKKRKISQLHLGGGTPTSLTEKQFDVLMQALSLKFSWEEESEISIEIDPRTVFLDQGAKLKHLRSLGFNRVSFGVQDLDPNVQEAVKRRQTEEMTTATYFWAKELGFSGINLDLIYGLPLQTQESFKKTVEKILFLKPDRIAFFSYAKIPWLKTHQKAIREEDLPSDTEKFGIYTDSRKSFMESGYTAIGMDHFSLHSDPLTIAYQEKKIIRNFQGYSLNLASDMLGLGVTSIGFVENAYFQNKKTISEYGQSLEKKELPVERGYLLQEEDLLRYWVIQKVMCHFEVDKKEFKTRFGISFDTYFTKKKSEMDDLVDRGWIENTPEIFKATPIGRLFIRLIASLFDAYLSTRNFSKAI